MGMQTPFCGGMPQGLNLNETLMPQYLSEVGYTAHAGTCAHVCMKLITSASMYSWKMAPWLYNMEPHSNVSRIFKFLWVGLLSLYSCYVLNEDDRYYNCAEDYFSHSVPLKNCTYGIDFHDDKEPNCGAGQIYSPH